MPFDRTVPKYFYDLQHGHVDAETWNRLEAQRVAAFLLDAKSKGFTNCIDGFRDTITDAVDWKCEEPMPYTISDLIDEALSAFGGDDEDRGMAA